jgi:hypothetical protein
MAEMTNAYKIFVKKPEGKNPIGRPWHRWQDNIRLDHRKIGKEDMDRVPPAQDRDQWQSLVNMVTKFCVPQRTIS